MLFSQKIWHLAAAITKSCVDEQWPGITGTAQQVFEWGAKGERVNEIWGWCGVGMLEKVTKNAFNKTCDWNARGAVKPDMKRRTSRRLR